MTTNREVLASERLWIEKRDEDLPLVMFKAAWAAYMMEHEKTRAEAKEKFIANCVSEFGEENLTEMLELRHSYIRGHEKNIQQYENFVLNAVEKSLDTFKSGLEKKLEKPPARTNW